MLREYKTKTNIGIGIGLVLQLLPILLVAGNDSAGANSPGGRMMFFYIALGCRIVGLIFMIWGCCCYMIGKGYSGAWGLLGLLSLIGLIILVCFPDRYKDGVRREARGFEVQPPAPGQPYQGYPPPPGTRNY
jgi:hypothetical protein